MITRLFTLYLAVLFSLSQTCFVSNDIRTGVQGLSF
jgi:hypothetical protein